MSHSSAIAPEGSASVAPPSLSISRPCLVAFTAPCLCTPCDTSACNRARREEQPVEAMAARSFPMFALSLRTCMLQMVSLDPTGYKGTR